MAEKTAAQKKKTTIMAAFAFLFGLYRLGTPYLEETDEMRKEAAKIATQITDIKNDASQYGKGWQDRMDKIEREVKAQLPDSLDSGATLEYFLARFEKDNAPGAVTFLSVGTQAISSMSMKQGREVDKEPPRTQRYKFEARMKQDRVVPYIEHVEKYSGLFMITDFNFHLEQEAVGTLKMEMSLIFFLSPKDWVTDTKLAAVTTPAAVAPGDEEEDDDEDLKPKGWTQIFMPTLVDPNKRNNAREPAQTAAPRIKKVPQPDRLVGTSVVIDESLYEEGDRVAGWIITRVDPSSRQVTFKSGLTTKTVSVK